VAVVLDNRGIRPQSLEYQKQPVRGAKEAKEKDRSSCVANRILTTSSRCQIRAS
jgi:hypothetical protein